MVTQPKVVIYSGGKRPVENLDQFFLENRIAGQTFLVDPSRRTTIVGSQGTRLTIAANSFVDTTAWPVKESVRLYLNEVFTRSQMILSGLTNTSEDRILESAGQILIEARTDKQRLELTSPIVVDLPLQAGDNPLATQLFSGGVSQTSSFGAGFRFDWKPEKPKNIQLKTLGEKKYLHFQIDELNWWNCTSFFHRRRDRIMLSVRWLSDESSIDDIAAFLVFRDVNAVVRMYPSRHGFSSWNIPKGVFARTILIGRSEDKMLIGQSPWAQTSNQPIQIQMQACTKADVLNLIPEWSDY